MTDTAESNKLIRLHQQQQRLRDKIAREKRKIAAQERKNATRRKILIGAIIIEYAADNREFAIMLEKLKEERLIRPDDRALFGLAEQKKAGRLEEKVEDV